ncbi:MAG: rhodanese-like domain-containing protein [Deltaproteobacteria bacterium]|nr:rhodanese-like domain-containing protein [Deltaproteobacteria bacterium]
MSTPPTPPTPPKEPIAIRLVKVSFKMTTRRDASGVPRLPADFIAEQGQLVRILDVREEAELIGPLGHIPSVTHVPLSKIGEVPALLDRETCIVIVSARGGRAGVAACLLEELGMNRVAAMEGGMAAWKQLGFTTLRDPTSYRKVLKAIAPGMGRDGRPIVMVEKGSQLTAAQIVEHVGDPTSVRWVKLGAFLLHGKRSCVDGRDDNGVIGTPGGDAGELLLALAAVEKLTGKALAPAEVEQVLLRHIDTFGRFYMHTDVHAMNRLIVEGYRKDPRIAPFVKHLDKGEEWRQWMLAPPHELRAAVLEHVCRPDVMGCGHLRFAMTDPEFQVRPELTRAFLEAFHRLRWAGSPELLWIVLGGEHAEGAVANITLAGGLHSYTRVPLVSPSVAGAQIFINHPQVTSFLRHEMAAFLCEIGAATDEVALGAMIEELGTLQGSRTLARLAGGLPVFEIHFALDGTPQVTERGMISV